MLPLATAHLPGITGTIIERRGEEILARQPGETGDHWWLLVEKDSLATSQARAAVARAGQVAEELVGEAGARDREGRFVQWFSLPVAAVDNPGALRGAGYRSKMKVLRVTRGHKAIGPAAVAGVRWSLRIKGGNRDGGYRRARAIMDHLRSHGFPNYVGLARFGRSGSLGRYGMLLLKGQNLPARAEAGPGTCLRAAQDLLFNRWLAQRIQDGLLDACLPGEVLRTRSGEELVCDDAEHGRRRLDSWECVQMGPLFGAGMPPAGGVAAEREAALLAADGVLPAALGRLEGGRRAARVQPSKVMVDLSGDDVVLACELPLDTWLDTLLAELIRPPGA
jgi:tRNA pseudouridine13 synthase